jgi:hypothetical protein
MAQQSQQIYRASIYQIDDALMAISRAIYELEDKVHPELQHHIGVAEVLSSLYDTYVKAVDYIRECDSLKEKERDLLIEKYNLNELIENLGGDER